jgi:hypothetical protein
MPIKKYLAICLNEAKQFLLPNAENNYRAKIFSGNFLIYFFFAAVILKFVFVVFICSFSNYHFYADITRAVLIEMANTERAKHGLLPVEENPVLDEAASLKASDMEKNDYFNHVSPLGINPWHWFDMAGYDYKYAGENLAIGFLDSSEVQKAWVASPTHEANIVNNKYKDIGIAVLKANYQGIPATIVVQLFGTKQGKSQTTQLGINAAQSQTGVAPKGGVLSEKSNTPAGAKKVLGVSTVASPDRNSPIFKALMFFFQNYFGLIQEIIYGSLVFAIILLALNFALKADFGHVDILAKVVGFVALMAIFALLDQNLVSVLIPHALSIK